MSEKETITMPRPGSSYFKIIQQMLGDLFAAEKRRLDKAIANLIRQNNEIKSVSAAGFLYQGDFYTAEGFQQVMGAQKVTLHDSLTDQIDWHINDANTIATDQQQIGQIIYKLTQGCETLQEIRDTLPNCLAEMIETVNKLPRHNEPGCSLSSDIRGSRQFQKMLPKIEMYAACRLLY